MKKLAPIIFICYNRFNHTLKSLNALKNNKLAKNSKIFIFSDGPKKKSDEKKIIKIRDLLKKIKGFKHKKLIFRKKNYGNKKNIISAINQVFKKYKKIIVVEDDLVVSREFLDFMNLCLNYYRNHSEIWHINGWSYPFLKNFSDDVAFLKSMNCWGWATWKNKWSKISMKEDKYISIFTKRMIHNFDIQSSTNNWSQIIRNKKNFLSTWAVFWHATIFLNNGITVYPKYPLVKNIGADGSGRMPKTNKYKNKLNGNFKKFKLIEKIDVKKDFIEREFKYFQKNNTLKRKIFVYLKKFWFNSY